MQTEQKLNPVDLEVKRMMLECPLIFSSRLNALHHLFAVIGTEYEWEDGELVDVMYDEESDNPPILPPDKELPDIVKQLLQIEYERNVACYEVTKKYIDYLCADVTYTGSDLKVWGVYPMCEYSRMVQASKMPDKINKHWKEAIVEFAVWIMSQTWYILYDERINMSNGIETNFNTALEVWESMIAGKNGVKYGKLARERIANISNKMIEYVVSNPDR